MKFKIGDRVELFDGMYKAGSHEKYFPVGTVTGFEPNPLLPEGMEVNVLWEPDPWRKEKVFFTTGERQDDLERHE